MTIEIIRLDLMLMWVPIEDGVGIPATSRKIILTTDPRAGIEAILERRETMEDLLAGMKETKYDTLIKMKET